ncbi:MAG: two-component regulator propeller domain-containing protein [Bacteroidota bacterium]
MAKKFISILIITIILSNVLLGQRVNHFDRHITLPEYPIFCISQDESGFIWFGTKNGLLRFDGYDFDIFNSVEGDSTTINNDWIWSLHNDSQGNLWVGTGLGLNLWMPEEGGFRNISLPLKNVESSSLIVRKILEDKENNLWLGTNHGLYTSKMNNHVFKKHELHFDLSQSTDFDIKEISEDLNGNIVISSQYGVFSLENKQTIAQNGPLNSILISDEQSDEVRSIFLNKLNKTYWVGTQSQQTALIKYREGLPPKILSLPGSTETNCIRVIKNFGDENLWLGTMNGLIIYDTIKNETSSLLEYQSVRDIFKDKEGGIWIATYNDGIYYRSARGSWFEHIIEFHAGITALKSQRQNVVNDMVIIDSDQILMATEFSLKLYDANSKDFLLYPSVGTKQRLENSRIKCMELDKENNTLWIGTFNGLTSLDIKTGSTRNFNTFSKNESSGSWREVYDIVVVDNEVWAGTNNLGLICISEEGLISQYSDHFNKSANHINVLHTSSDKTIWIGSNAGLSAIDSKNRRLRTIGNEKYFLKSKHIVSIAQDDLGNLWLGTEKSGLIYFNPLTLDFLTIKEEDGLLSNKIKSLEIDNKQHLWVTTEEGLSEIILSNTNTFSSISFEIFDYSVQSELGDLNFVANSSYKTQEGDIFFGTRNGVLKFSPDVIQNKRWHPKVWIREIEINQEPISKEKSLIQRFGSVEELSSLELNHDESVLSIKFSSLNYSQSDRLHYSYILEGIDEEWQLLDHKRDLSFSFLPPGDYHLKLKASNSKQKWGDLYTSLHIKIHPPFHKSGIAFIIYACIILILMYLFYHYSTQWQKMKNQLLIEELDKNKEQELHQLKSEFFMNISHELKSPLKLILEPIEDLLAQKINNPSIRSRLRAVRRNAEKILNLANQIVDIRKMETSGEILKVAQSDLRQFIKDIASRFNELSRLKNIDFNVITNEQEINVWFDESRLDTAVSNILSNAFKYTKENGEITISVSLKVNEDPNSTPNKALIMIEDNGKGIAKEDQKYLFDRFHHLTNQNKRMSLGDGIGLDLAKKVVDLHHGSIDVDSLQESKNAHGLTRITISLQLGNTHFDSENILLKDDSPKDKKQFQNKYNYEIMDLDDRSSSIISSDHTILVVDDNIKSRHRLHKLFLDSYHVYEVADGLEGWKLALDIIPSLIILTENTSTIDGHEFCQRVKIDERTCHIPVILVTDVNDAHNQFEFLADEYIQRPIDLAFLKQKVDHLIVQRDRVRKQFEKNSILKPVQVSSYDEKLLNDTIEFIDANLSDPHLSIERISKEIGISRVHFYRKIKALLGMSPNEFVRTYRIKKAGQLLEQKKLNVSDVRMMVGFNDSDYFRSCFKKEYGLTPSEFTKKYSGSIIQ